ncbi:MAG: hypothetical protein IKU29_07305 [Parabacteroides sp.]|nr:hypothetical protein [Parabacteroides sp.]
MKKVLKYSFVFMVGFVFGKTFVEYINSKSVEDDVENIPVESDFFEDECDDEYYYPIDEDHEE